MATGAEADFEAPFELLDEDHRYFGPFDSKRQINRIFGIAGQSSGFDEVLFANIGMHELTIALDG
ncbi:MAG: hypothetical protein ACKO9Q_20630, partial [Pirellula sp.]